MFPTQREAWDDARNSFKASVTASRAAEAAVAWGTLDDCFAACELPQQHHFDTLCEPILRKQSSKVPHKLAKTWLIFLLLHRNDHVTEMGYI